jgi:hypothetical protein
MMELLPLILGLLGVFFVLGPLAVWGIVGEDESPHFDVYDPSLHVVPHEVTTFLLQNVAALAAEGFKPVGDLFRQHGTQTTRIALLQHPDGATGTVAVITSQQGTAGSFVEFTAELSGGRILDVNNVATVPVFAPRPLHETYRFSVVRDPNRLYRIFRALLRRRFGASTLQPRDLSDPARFLADAYNVEHRWQVEAGYYRFDDKARRFRPTLKGAFLMTWKLLPPMAQLRRAALRKRARALLEQIGMEGSSDERPVVAPVSVTAVEPLPGVARRTTGSRATGSRTTGLSGVAAWTGIVLLFVADFAIERLTGSRLLAFTVLFGGMIGLLWLMLRRHGGGRAVVPLAVLGCVGLGMMGFREFQARQPIDRESFSVPADFPGAVAALEHLARTTARPLVVRGLDGQRDTTPGFYVAVRAPRALAVLDSAIRKEFREQGFYLFWWVRYRGKGGRLDRVGLYPSADQYAVVRAMQTGGPNVGPDTIVAWFRALERDYRFKFVTIGPNNIEGRLAVDSAGALDVARRFSEFCPELERRGVVTTEQRAAALLQGGYFHCWWEPRAR